MGGHGCRNRGMLSVELLRVYVEFNKVSEFNPMLAEEARTAVLDLEAGRPEALDLWRWVRGVCRVSVEETLKALGVEFDVWDAPKSLKR